eukprot:CAMPEP_0178956266 /NCGR_PEP_ID=MMETSP0789-20121207/10129_1 /TAXON_ID=3005 /ORGANISM="Rhizosolenia setigera, Strain CCMP 1694" /LENGTH=118 /DNA_ID=CAMNT_0020638117 /DNA_START=291 /DNA_END=643 /DNA_ORIENTATION=+
MNERKKRTKVLSSGVLLKLMKRSDYEGCKRLFLNIGLIFLNAFGIYKLDIHGLIMNGEFPSISTSKLLAFVPLYFIYGFLMQCLAFAGGHELHHGNAFKTKWMSTAATTDTTTDGIFA